MPSDPFALFLLGCLGVILFGIAVLVARRLVAGPPDVFRDDSLDLTLRVAGWVLITGGFAAAFFALFQIIGVVLSIAALVVTVETLVKHRLSRQYALLWLLTVAAERRIPLVPAIEAFAREGGGLFAGRARYLAAMIRAGVPLPEALERSPGLLPRDVLPVIRVGYESGGLAAALRQAASVRDFQRPLWLFVAGKLVYLMVLVAVGVSIVTFVMYSIVPAFQSIFLSFNAPLPKMTQMLISVSRAAFDLWYLLALFFLSFGLLSLYVLLRYIGLTNWELPGTSWVVRRLDTAAVLEALSLAAEYRRPLPEALASLARSYPKWSIRRRLRGVSRDLDGGADWCRSLLARGLLKQADLAVLQAAQRVGNLPWALREMAESNRRRLAYRMQALVQLAFPPLILALGAMVAFIVVGLFIPIVALIQSMV